MFFFFKQKTAYEMRISDWSSDVCSSDLRHRRAQLVEAHGFALQREPDPGAEEQRQEQQQGGQCDGAGANLHRFIRIKGLPILRPAPAPVDARWRNSGVPETERSEEHTSELQSLMRNSYAVFCLKNKIICSI